MKNKWTFVGGLVMVALLALTVRAGQAQGPGPQEVGIQADLVGTAFTYQGQLKSGGSPVNGTCDFEFSLWNSAGGDLQVGTTQTKSNVTVSNGLFTIPDLDFGNNAFTGDARWLQIAVRCPAGSGSYTTLSPRQALTAAPYALSLRPGAVVEGGAPGAGLRVSNTAPTGAYGVWGESVSTYGFGVYGYASAASGYAHGVFGRSASTGGSGVYGTAPALGVFGWAIATSGTTYGLYGVSDSTDGRGVYGQASAASGTTYGVYGSSTSTDGRGVYGTAPSFGVYGHASATSGGATGVFGQSDSSSGWGVYGYAYHTGGGHGVYAQSRGPAEGGAALYALNSHSGGIAMWGQNNSTDSTLVLVNQGSGDLIKAFISAGELRFRFQNDGWARADGGWTTPASDMAEMLPAVPGLEPGDVLIIGADGKLARSTQAYQPTVVGVYSTRPGFVGGQPVDGEAEGHIPLAVVGVVPVKASAENGPIQPGDLLVASATPGHAMRAGVNPPQGTVIGKALEGLEEGAGVIQMLVVLQ
ncbi:MAG: hypothetical protein WHX52_22520 [Anaerolineae bacterium]